MRDARRMSLLRFLGLGARESSDDRDASETRTVRRIAAQLEALDPETARFLAAFAYVLARVANADLEIDADETQEMQRIVEEVGDLRPQEAALAVEIAKSAALAVEIAKSQTRLMGGTENYLVTREFARVASREQRARLLQCLYAVAAADGSISSTESGEITSIAQELGFAREEANALRAQYRDKLAVLRKRDER
jgi:uncharacterized tellurite resistance protein B-like protein